MIGKDITVFNSSLPLGQQTFTVTGLAVGEGTWTNVYTELILNPNDVYIAGTGTATVTIITPPVPVVYSDTAVNLPTVPVWFIAPDYKVLPTVTMVGNTATTETSFSTSTTVIAYADWYGGNINGHYLAEEMPFASTSTITGYRSLGNSIALSISPTTAVLGETLNIQLTTDNSVNLSGTTATIFVDGSPLTNLTFNNNVASTSTIIEVAGNLTMNGIWSGGRTPDRRFYQSKSSNSVLETINERGTYPGTLVLSGNSNVYQLDNQTFTLTTNLSTATHNNVYLQETYNGYVKNLSTATFTGTTISFTVNPNDYLSTGNNSHNLHIYWEGQTYVRNTYYPYYGVTSN